VKAQVRNKSLAKRKKLQALFSRRANIKYLFADDADRRFVTSVKHQTNLEPILVDLDGALLPQTIW